jgi:uncharacterized protein YifE (UPF0438 family)
VFHRRLEQQRTNADRRLQELLFECLGEYEKARLRATRRSEHLSSMVDEQLQACAQSMLWSHFLARLEEELQTVTLTNVDPLKRFEEFSELQRFCQDQIMASTESGGRATPPHIERVVQLRPRSGRTSRRQRDNPNVVSKVHPAVASAVVALISGAASRPRGQDDMRQNGGGGGISSSDSSAGVSGLSSPVRIYPPGTALHPSFDRSMVLSSRPVAWLLLPKWAAAQPPSSAAAGGGEVGGTIVEASERSKLTLANCRVYFHVEERTKRLASKHDDSTSTKQTLADHICDIYAGLSSEGREPYSDDESLIVAAATHLHRDPKTSVEDAAMADRVVSYPDVLQASAE